MIAGLHPLTDGDLLIAGRRVNGATAEDLAGGLCLVPEGRGVFPNLSVREHLRMATYTGTSLSDIEGEAYARFAPLAKRRNQAAGTLSGGEQQMLAMARAVATRPALLLLDELSMGLAPIVVEDLYAKVAEIARARHLHPGRRAVCPDRSRRRRSGGHHGAGPDPDDRLA